jgi:hypothetical protein
MPHYKLLFPNEYLGAPDLRGRDVTLTIDTVRMESLKREDGDEEKPIVHFIEMRKRPKKKRKKWVLNKTNATQIAKLYGPEVNAWHGCRVTLYATTCQAFGQTVECIRVRDSKPHGSRNEPEPGDIEEPDADDPFAEDFDPTEPPDDWEPGA